MHKSILIINGPNLNLLGTREPDIYGNQTFETYFKQLIDKYTSLQLTYFQSNHEGELLDKLHHTIGLFDGIIINAGAYTHTSIAIADAISAIGVPVIEVHISNVYNREAFRHNSYLTTPCIHTIVGEGMQGYDMAIDSFQMAPTSKSISAIVHGKVQGVWFRYSTKNKADSLKIIGNVNNSPDGTVRIRASGSMHNIDTFIKFLHRGPEQAIVNKVEIEPIDSFTTDGFKINR